MTLIFSSLPPAYFTPSTPPNLPSLFLKHGGKILPCNPHDTTDPLDLPVSFYFVNRRSDELINHLVGGGRPLVLYDAAWVMSSVLTARVERLTSWIVDVDMWSSGSPISRYAFDPEVTTSKIEPAVSASNKITDTSNSSNISRILSTKQVESKNRKPVKARYILDFDKKTSLDVVNGKLSGLELPLQCAKSNKPKQEREALTRSTSRKVGQIH